MKTTKTIKIDNNYINKIKADKLVNGKTFTDYINELITKDLNNSIPQNNLNNNVVDLTEFRNLINEQNNRLDDIHNLYVNSVCELKELINYTNAIRERVVNDKTNFDVRYKEVNAKLEKVVSVLIQIQNKGK